MKKILIMLGISLLCSLNVVLANDVNVVSCSIDKGQLNAGQIFEFYDDLDFYMGIHHGVDLKMPEAFLNDGTSFIPTKASNLLGNHWMIEYANEKHPEILLSMKLDMPMNMNPFKLAVTKKRFKGSFIIVGSVMNTFFNTNILLLDVTCNAHVLRKVEL